MTWVGVLSAPTFIFALLPQVRPSGGKDKQMKIKYEFADGTKTEVEVTEEVGAVIIDSRKAEHAQDEKQRYHCYSLDAIDFEGLEYATKDSAEDFPEELQDRVRYAFSMLTPIQQRRILKFSNGKSMREIAREENASVQSVQESILAARKKFLKFF